MSMFSCENFNKSEIQELAYELSVISALAYKFQDELCSAELEQLLNLSRKMSGAVAAFLLNEIAEE